MFKIGERIQYIGNESNHNDFGKVVKCPNQYKDWGISEQIVWIKLDRNAYESWAKPDQLKKIEQ